MILHNATVDTILERLCTAADHAGRAGNHSGSRTIRSKRHESAVSNCCGSAIADACTGFNPRIPSQEEMEQLLKACYYDLAVNF